MTRFAVDFCKQFRNDVKRIQRHDFFDRLLAVLQELRPQDQLVVAVAPAAGEVDGGTRAYGHDDDGAPLKAWVWTMRLVVAARDHVFAGADGSAEREFLGVLLGRLETRLGRDSAFLLPPIMPKYQLKGDTDTRPGDRFMMGVKAMHGDLEACHTLPSGAAWPAIEDMESYGDVTAAQLRALAADTIGHISSGRHARSISMVIAILSSMFLVRHYGHQPGADGDACVLTPLLLEEALTVDEGPEEAVAEGPEEAVAEGPEEAVAEVPEEVVAEGSEEAVAEGPEEAVAEGPAPPPHGQNCVEDPVNHTATAVAAVLQPAADLMQRLATGAGGSISGMHVPAPDADEFDRICKHGCGSETSPLLPGSPGYMGMSIEGHGGVQERDMQSQHADHDAGPDASASLLSNDAEAHVPSANNHGTAPGHAGGAGACCCQKAFRDWVEDYAGVLEAAAKHIYDLEAQLECMRMEIRRVYGGGKHMSEAPFPQDADDSDAAATLRALQPPRAVHEHAAPPDAGTAPLPLASGSPVSAHKVSGDEVEQLAMLLAS